MIKKYLHTRFRVSDMDKSISFYQDILGMEVIEEKTSPRGSKLVFLKFPGTDCDLELCSFPNSGLVYVPEDLVHLAFEVENLEDCINRLNAAGIPSPMILAGVGSKRLRCPFLPTLPQK